jgi:hypothetical protein
MTIPGEQAAPSCRTSLIGTSFLIHAVIAGTPISKLRTFNYADFNEIMPSIYSKFMEKEAKQWRQIYKVCRISSASRAERSLTAFPVTSITRISHKEWVRESR